MQEIIRMENSNDNINYPSLSLCSGPPLTIASTLCLCAFTEEETGPAASRSNLAAEQTKTTQRIAT